MDDDGECRDRMRQGCHDDDEDDDEDKDGLNSRQR